MIKFEHVTKTFPGGQHALQDVSVDIKQGEFVYVLGHSGAGKSTFLKMILLETKPTSGKVIVNGEDFSRLKKRDIPYRRRQIGVVFQDFRLIDTMTVYENVAFAMRVTNISEAMIKKRVPYVLKLVRLLDKKDNYPYELSGGEQQRVAIARAVVHSPKLIIADEPTGNIDPELSFEMMELLTAINTVGITVVVVTHEHDLVNQFHRRVIKLDHGRVVQDTAQKFHQQNVEFFSDGAEASQEAMAVRSAEFAAEISAQAPVDSAPQQDAQAAEEIASEAAVPENEVQPEAAQAAEVADLPEKAEGTEPAQQAQDTVPQDEAMLESLLKKVLQDVSPSRGAQGAGEQSTSSQPEEVQHEPV